MSSNLVKSDRFGLIILAAGESARMGKPKQLLEFKGESLLRRAARSAAGSACGNVAVVLGANFEILKKELAGFDVEIVRNRGWEKGMGGSIRAGLATLCGKNKSLRAVVITVCDQPFADAKLIDDLIAKYLETRAPVVASAYSETLGVPAIFDQTLFAELSALDGEKGAKAVIRKHSASAVSIAFPEGKFDIDTPEDYSRLPGFFG